MSKYSITCDKCKKPIQFSISTTWAGGDQTVAVYPHNHKKGRRKK